jgi:papain like protease/type IX secretion system substrate protein
MKKIIRINTKILFIFFGIYMFFNTTTVAQTITVNSTYTQTNEIYPFGSTGTVYGLRINGNFEFSNNSDTSLIRVILVDSDFNEYLVFESYPYIADDLTFEIDNICDETCFSEGFIPYSLIIQITCAELNLSNIVMNPTNASDATTQQKQSKRITELAKVDNIRNRINQYQMLWFADTNSISNLSFSEKKDLFGDGYNMCGLDYYVGGLFDPEPNTIRNTDNSSLVTDFDWRNRHGANDPKKTNFYYENGRLGNGWMTSIKDQTVINLCKNLCYIYGPIAAVEGVSNLYFNQFMDYELSVQHVLECSALVNGYGDCDGGYGGSLGFIRDNGVVDSLHYPRRYPNKTCWEDLDPNDYLYNLFINQSKPVITTIPDPDEIDHIKQAIIEYGPLSVSLNNYSGGISHKMALVGYGIVKIGDIIHGRDENFTAIPVPQGSDYIGKLYWIFKNSWNLDWGDNGYMYHLDDGSHPGYCTYLELPVTVETNIQPSVLCFDKDKDGYPNWGLSTSKPNDCDCPVSSVTLKDSDDSEPRIGPFDENYFGEPVAPKMEVWLNSGSASAYQIYDDEFITFVANSNKEFNVTIKNLGNAQLNLEEITSSNGSVFVVPPDTDPEYLSMTTGEFTFTVHYQYNSGTLDNQTVITIPTLEPEYGDFQFVLANFDCSQTNGSNINISTSQSWNECDIIAGNVFITNGAELTITGHYAFLSNVNIIVTQGSRLILDGAVLTTACEASIWKGIDVWGVTSQSQMVTSNQGYLEIKNNTIIYNAENAVEAAQVIDNAYIFGTTGGIVACRNSKFINNVNDVTIYPYNNFHPVTKNPELNLGYFDNTVFEVNKNISGIEPRVCLAGVNGIIIKGSEFNNEYVNGFSNANGVGIYSFNSGFYVDRYCLESNPSGGCANTKLSSFTNLYHGIYAINGELSKYISIDTASFKNCQYGVFMSVVDNQTVTRNTFITSINNYLSGNVYGLYLETCKGYTVEENNFINETTGLNTMGIQILNSGQVYNEIYNNTFNNMKTGISAAGKNRDAEGNGLCIKCNDFEDCITDICVEPGEYPSGSTIGIAEIQGAENTSGGTDPTLAAGNTFTKDNSVSNYNIHTDCNSVSYTHHKVESTNEKIIPTLITNKIQLYADVDALFSKESSCPSNLNVSIIDELVEKSILTSKLIVISSYHDTLDLLTDGGDTESLNTDIQFSMPDEALELRQQLLDESPYLSDTAMKSAIDKENVLPNVMIREILVANPQSAKTPDVLQMIDSRIDPMPGFMMSEIMGGENILGAKEVLEQNLSFHKSERDKSLTRLERYYLSDTANTSESNDSLIALWYDEPYIASKYNLSFHYIINGDSSNSIYNLDNIPLEFDLVENEENTHQDYEILFNVLEQLHCDSVKLDSNMIQSLLPLSAKLTRPGIYARNILINDNKLNFAESLYFPDLFKSNKLINYEMLDVEKELLIKVYPNPAGDYFIIEYNLYEPDGNSIIVISDINGKKIKSFKLKDEHNQLIISTEDFKSGTYLIHLLVNDKNMEAQKIIIAK